MTNFLHVKESLRVRVRRSRVYWEGRREEGEGGYEKAHSNSKYAVKEDGSNSQEGGKSLWLHDFLIRLV